MSQSCKEARFRRTVAVMVLLGAALVPCMAHSRDAPGEPTEMRFCYWANHVENEFFRWVTARFEELNPDVRIRREWFVGDYNSKLQLNLITGKAADIILMDDEIFPRYSVRGYLEDLSPYILRESDDVERSLARELRHMQTPEGERDPDFESAYLPTALDSFNYRGFQGGLPWDGNAQLIYFNKNIFDEAGLAYPTADWTWQDFRELAKKLTKDEDGDGVPERFGTNYGFDWFMLQPPIWCFGGHILNEDRTRSLIQEPEAIEAVQLLYDMKMEDRSMAWAGELEGFLTEVQLLTGRVAMVPAMSYMLPMLGKVKDTSVRWGVTQVPKGPDGLRYTRVTWDGISINAHITDERKEIAWRFVKFFASDEVQAQVGKMQKGLPIRHDLVFEHYVRGREDSPEMVALEAMQYGRLTPITPRFVELKTAMNTELYKLLTADIYKDPEERPTPEGVLSSLEPMINNILDKEIRDWQADTEEEGASPWHGLWVAALVVLLAFAAAMLIPPVRRSLLHEVAECRHMMHSSKGRLDATEGLLFASPWLVGLLFLQAFPILFSVVLSFCSWDPNNPISDMRFIGLGNYLQALSQNPVTGDPLVAKALYNTFYYAIFAVPLGLATSLGLAMLLNQKVRGITIFRTTFYLPSIIAGVATVILWQYIFNPTFGPLNTALHGLNQFFDWTVVLSFVDLPEPKWFGDPAWAKPAVIIMHLWGAGGAAMLIFLAGLQGVPDQLYEVAELDGANRLSQFKNITLPMLTPTIYFNLIMGMIGSLKVFMQSFILTAGTGGVDHTLLFYVLHLYNKAFVQYQMGYASALAWILFLIIMTMTLFVIRSSAVWVYYEGEKRTK